MEQGYRTATIGIVVLLVTAGAFYLWAASSPQYSAGTLVIDWRLNLTIHDVRNLANYAPPAGIGVRSGIWLNHTLDRFGPAGYAPVSTRDNSGTIYVQSTAPRGYTFGYFFDLWGQPFNRQCVPDGRNGVYCSGPGTPPPFMSDGDSERCIDRSLFLSNGKDWIIFIGSPSGLSGVC